LWETIPIFGSNILHKEDLLLIAAHPSGPLDETHCVENIEQILDEEHTSDGVIFDPKTQTKNKSSKVNNSSAETKVWSPLDEVSRCVVVTRGEKDLENKALTSIADLEEGEEDHKAVHRAGELWRVIGWGGGRGRTWGSVASERREAQDTISKAPSSICAERDRGERQRQRDSQEDGVEMDWLTVFVETKMMAGSCTAL
jgi:hypothetical protein